MIDAEFWYGKLGRGWSARRFKHTAHVVGGQVDPTDARYRNATLFAPNHIESGTGRLLDTETAAEQSAESGKYPVRAGDVLYSKIRPALRKVAIAPTDGLCSADMYALRPKNSRISPQFLFYVLLSEGFARYSVLESDRVAMPKINREALGECPLVMPALPLQQRIADFLDRKTAVIDELIAKKERLVAVLAEKRQALITQLVTKGLDPTVPMKDSGLPWIGRVPAHWSVGALALWWDIIDCKHRTAEYTPDGYPIVSTTEVKPGLLDLSACTRFVPELDFRDLTSGGRLPRVGDIVYSRNASLGAAAFVGSQAPFAMGQDVVLIRSGRQEQRYLADVLNGPVGQIQVDLAGIGSTFKRINVAAIARLRVPVPPAAEQREIAKRSAEISERAQTIGRRNVQSLERLREYRQALITAAVTGQLDLTDERAIATHDERVAEAGA